MGGLRAADTLFDMSGPWTVLFYAEDQGREPIREWLDDLARKRPGEHGAVRHGIDLLEQFGVLLEHPHRQADRSG